MVCPEPLLVGRLLPTTKAVITSHQVYNTTMNLNATKCTFGHSDNTRRKRQYAEKTYDLCFRNNTVFVIFEQWATK